MWLRLPCLDSRSSPLSLTRSPCTIVYKVRRLPPVNHWSGNVLHSMYTWEPLRFFTVTGTMNLGALPQLIWACSDHCTDIPLGVGLGVTTLAHFDLEVDTGADGDMRGSRLGCPVRRGVDGFNRVRRQPCDRTPCLTYLQHRPDSPCDVGW